MVAVLIEKAGGDPCRAMMAIIPQGLGDAPSVGGIWSRLRLLRAVFILSPLFFFARLRFQDLTAFTKSESGFRARAVIVQVQSVAVEFRDTEFVRLANLEIRKPAFSRQHSY
ncbi:MAG: hypothetical protein ACRCXD_11635 [Luteolibacter sp.]